MTIKNTKEGSKLSMNISGRLDTMTAPEFETAVSAVIENVTDLIINLDDLEYISSAGLRVLLSTQKTMNKQGTMKVINVHDSIMEIFEITGFTDIMTIEKA